MVVIDKWEVSLESGLEQLNNFLDQDYKAIESFMTI